MPFAEGAMVASARAGSFVTSRARKRQELRRARRFARLPCYTCVVATLAGKVIYISGASRGIGAAIARRAARDGARLVVAAKTGQRHPKLAGTIHTVAEEIRGLGGQASPQIVDVRDAAQIESAVGAAVAEYGGIDIVINNASAINLAQTDSLSLARFDLMHQVNVRGTFATVKACLPHLRRSDDARIITLCPPLPAGEGWLGRHVGYSASKFGMSLLTAGFAEEFADAGFAVHGLWPRTTIATAAIEMLMGESGMRRSRKPEIVADAAYHLMTRARESSDAVFHTDEDVLRSAGITDFSGYAVDASAELCPDLFVDF